jgi:glycosyltransferase involved in cell wall biosynthesis
MSAMLASAGDPSLDPSSTPELSVVMPCLNEADTIAVCVEKALRAMREQGISGEVVVADNGSTDGSAQIAERCGARVVRVEAPGYGSALMGGIAASSGRFVIMGDADDSYDFLEIPALLSRLREGFELVQGCRLPSGGGTVRPGAMPFSHRWLGNPVLSFLVRRMFKASIHDVYCGLRGFSRALYERLQLRCTGMEFATEMIIKATLRRERIAEVPITLHPDGRRSHAPHLKTWSDGWRTLRFFLMSSPRWIFVYPGLLLILAGLLGYGLALPGLTIRSVTFDVHTLLFSSLFILLGYQALLFAVMAKSFAVKERLLPPDERLDRFYRVFNLERGILLSAVSFLVGAGLLLWAINKWRLTGFGRLDYAVTMRWVIPGVLLTALGFQTFLFGFLTSIIGMNRS